MLLITAFQSQKAPWTSVIPKRVAKPGKSQTPVLRAPQWVAARCGGFWAQAQPPWGGLWADLTKTQ